MISERYPFSFYFCLIASLFIGIFYNTVTNTAGVYIVSDLGGELHTSVYSMVFFGLGNLLGLPLANPLAKFLGSISLLVKALLAFSFFSFLCAIAPTYVAFNIFRVFLGSCCGFFYVLCRRILIEHAGHEKVHRYSFYMILMNAIVPVLGTCFGAWLGYENFWREIFVLVIPVTLFLSWYLWFFYRKYDLPLERFIFDWVSYFFYCLGLSCLITALTLAQQLDWYRSDILVSITVIGIPSLCYFVMREWISETPILDLRLLKSLRLSFSLLNLAVLFSCYYGMIILITLWLSIYVNYTPWWITLLIATMGTSGMIAFWLTQSVFVKHDPRLTLGFSILCFTASCYYSTYFDVDVDLFHLSVARALSGLGLVLFVLPLFRISQSAYKADKSSSVFVLVQTTRALFSSLGAGLYVILWQRRQVFFHERLGEGLTINSQLTMNYFQRATEIFNLSPDQAKAQLDVFLETHATSLALNDVFGYMGYVLVALFFVLILSFWKKKHLGICLNGHQNSLEPSVSD